MTQEQLLEQINLGEDNEIEFKSAKGGLPKSIWESVSAFANTNGGYIILGVEEDDGKFHVGSLKNSTSLITNFWNLHNSSEKLSVPVCQEDDVQVFTIDGKETSILEAFPHFHLDYQENFSNDPDVRWTHRITSDGRWECNIFNFYMRVYNRLVQDVEVPFELDSEGVRKGETHVHEALREALVNTLVHANHQSSKSITIIKSKEYFSFKNPGRLRITIEQVYQGGMSDVRNPYIQRIFQLIGLGEKAGSGFMKILRAWDEQHWMKPQVSEDAVHELTSVKLVHKLDKSKKSPSKQPSKDLENHPSNEKTREIILGLILKDPKITQKELAEEIGISPKGIEWQIKQLKIDGTLMRIGPAKGGHWEVRI